MWNTPYARGSFRAFAEDIDAGGDASPSTAMLSDVSKRLGITIVGGSIPEKSGGRFYNTCCVFGSHGELLAKHRKVCFFFFSEIKLSIFVLELSFCAGRYIYLT